MKKSDYAFIVSCTPGYSFGLLSSMNAQNFYGTNADWEIAYEGFDPEYMDKVSAAFPFNVNWTPVSDLMKEVNDRRTDQRGPLDRMWLSYWLMAHKVLREKKYKAVCVIQADTFVFVNLDNYFKIAEAGILVNSEYPFNFLRADELPFGDDHNVWDRGISAIFDGINFIGQEYAQLPRDIVTFQEEDSFRGEANHSVIALNRAVCKHGRKDKVLSLNGRLWVCDSIWGSTRLYAIGDKVYNGLEIQLNAWHTRWWQKGRAEAEWRSSEALVTGPNGKEAIPIWDNCEHNYNFTRDFMQRFNNMIPSIRSEEYVKDYMRRPKYELGEK
jgi:hypothetical protein